MANRNNAAFTHEQPTNFCACIECLQPLTPDDIHQHYEFHASNGTNALIQSIRNTKLICAKKLTSTISELTKGIEDHDIQYILNPEELYNQEVKKMDQCRDTMIDIIKIFIETQKKKLKSSIELNLLKVKDIGSVFGEIKEVIAQLEGLRNSLEKTDPFAAISKTCRLDVKSMVDRYKSQIKKVMTTRDLDPITVHIDEQMLFQLNRTLAKIIHVITHQETEDSVRGAGKQESSQVLEHHSELPELIDHHRQESIHSRNSNVNVDVRLHESYGPPQTPPPPNKPSGKAVQPQPQHQPPAQRQPPAQHQPPPQPSDSLFKVQQNDYFEKASSKFLHFFKNEDTLLYMLDLTQAPKFKMIRLNQNFTVPYFHRSIATPKGEIYLSGGTLADDTKSGMIYYYDPAKQCLQGTSELIIPRSSHTMVYCQGQVFLISGFAVGKQLTTSVERFNTSTMQVSRMADCLQPANSPTCCVFANRFIYKFGGNQQDGSLVQLIERYDITRNLWEHIDPKLDEHEIQNFDQIYQYAACSQINQNSILVFGGYDQENQGTSFSFLLTLDENQESTIQGTYVKPVPSAEGFWNNQCVVFGGKLYVLQNIDVEGEIDETRRKILCFDGVKWIDLGEGI